MIKQILERMNLCGCGQPDVPYRVIREVLELLWLPDDYSANREKLWNDRWARICLWLNKGGSEEDPLKWFALYVMDTWDLTEHGGSIGGAWLTDDGRELLMFLREVNCDHGKIVEAMESEGDLLAGVKGVVQ